MESPLLPKYLTDRPSSPDASREPSREPSKLPSPASSPSASTVSPQTSTATTTTATTNTTTATTENTSIPASIPATNTSSASTASSAVHRRTAKEKGKGRAAPSKGESPVKMAPSPPPPVPDPKETRSKRSLSLSKTKRAARKEPEEDKTKQQEQTRESPKIDKEDDTALVRDESPPAFLMEDPLLAPQPDTRERTHDEFEFEGFTLSPIRPTGDAVRRFPGLSRLGSGSGIFASTPSNQTARTKIALPDDDVLVEGGLASSTPIASQVSQASQEPPQEPSQEASRGNDPNDLITFDLSQTQLRQTVEDYLRSITDEEVRRVRSHGEARIQEIESMIETVRQNITQGST
ncbi:hypothetical protein BCR43DRAFT_490384 [Syncephalastrum racemosum]|uniref:Uncharacterized protein n=1 Tax=Syncephalastrum racemosum TaxID=13706 RepID=A0A1X2HFX1_SYNRA|nr:hypothetical protein BCR43DRAFT_490384 [Syncephalastrum racemosum]